MHEVLSAETRAWEENFLSWPTLPVTTSQNQPFISNKNGRTRGRNEWLLKD